MNYSKAIVAGNLTRDPELRYTKVTTAVVNFTVAVNRRWKGKDGAVNEKAAFVDCVAFGHTAEHVNKYFKKGKGIFVEGFLDFDSWTDNSGQQRSKLYVHVEKVEFTDGGTGASSGQGQHSGGNPHRDDEPF